MKRLDLRLLLAGLAAFVVTAGCSVTATDLPLPGGADVGDNPYDVTIEFRDVLDLVPQSAVRVDDIAVGRVKSVKLEGWTAVVVVTVNGDVTADIGVFGEAGTGVYVNNDGSVNTQDVLAFLNAWNADDPSSDCNGDSSINTQDVLCFLNLWNAGC